MNNLIISLRFNTQEVYDIFRAAFEAAYSKFSAHIPNHPARSIFYACQVFDPTFIHSGDGLRKNIQKYSVIKEFDNLSDELLRE